MRFAKIALILLIPAFFLAAFNLPGHYSRWQAFKTPIPRSLDPDGPWIIMHDPLSLMVANSDGTGLEQLFAGMRISGVSLSPDSQTIAVILDDSPTDDSKGLSLALYQLPGGHKKITLPLQNPALSSGNDLTFEPHRAITLSTPAWSHDGNTVALIGQMDGPSADLYLYEMETRTITRLSTENDQAYQPSWSPDDRYVFFAAAAGFGTGAGYGNAGSWFISRDGKQIFETTSKDKSDHVIVWVDSGMAVLGEFGIVCGTMNLRLFKLDTQKLYSIWPDYVKDVAYSEANGQLALFIPQDFEGCTEGKQSTGLYFLEIKSGNLREIYTSYMTDLKLDSSTGRDFLLRNDMVLFRMDTAGNRQYLATTSRKSDPEYSAAADLWLWYKRPELYEGIWVGKLGETPRQVYEHPIGETTMIPGGKTIYFMEMGIGRLYRADAPDFDPVPIITSDKLEDWTHVIYADPGTVL